MNMTLSLLVGLSIAAPAVGQSRLAGFDPGSGNLVTARTEAAAATLEVIGSPGQSLHTLDFDASGQNLWATAEVGGTEVTGRLNLATGAFLERADLAAAPAFDDITADPDGATWWAVRSVGSDVELWSGDLPRGVMSLATTFPAFGQVSSIAVDRNGALFGHDEARGEIVTLDPATAQITVVGPIGITGAGLSGLDFDWATGELWTVLTSAAGAPRLARIDTASGAATLVESLPVSSQGLRIAIQRSTKRIDVRTFCAPAEVNSSGRRGTLQAIGSGVITRNDVVLEAASLARNTFGMFLVSLDDVGPVLPAGSVGTLCLGGSIGRIVSNGGLLATGPDGSFRAPLDLMQIPAPTGTIAVMDWSVWRFQAWFRDSAAGMATSNFTAAAEVELRAPIEGPAYGHPALDSSTADRLGVMDWDGDGLRDVVLYRRGRVEILPVEREGDDAVARVFPGSTSHFRLNGSIRDAGDLDGDGDPDVIALWPATVGVGSLWYGTNDGTGRLLTPLTQATSACARLTDARIADVDGDGQADVVFSCSSSLRYGVWYGGPGGFPVTYQEENLGRRTTEVIVEDLDGNGLADLVLLHGFTRNATVLLQNTPRSFQEVAVLTLPGNPASGVLADLDRDGRKELVVTLQSPDGLFRLAGLAGGQFGPPMALDTAPTPTGLTSADVNDDGWLDILVLESFDGQLAIHYNDRTGSLDAPVRTPTPARGTDLATADLDSDGELEAYVTHGGIPTTTIVELDPFDLLPVPERFPVTHSFGVLLEDINGDGRADALTWGTSGVNTRLGDGEGGFGPLVSHPGLFANTTTAHLEDIDGDGDVDFVARNTMPTGTINVSLNDGAGLFGAFQSYPTSISPRWIDLGDLNDDGLPEIVVAPSVGPGVEVLWNLGGTFGTTTMIPVDGDYMTATVGDVDDDGFSDVVIAAEGPGSSAGVPVRVAFGQGAGVLSSPVLVSSEVFFDTGGVNISLVDVDQDGLLDVFSGATYRYLRNNGSRSFSAASSGTPLNTVGIFAGIEQSVPFEFTGDSQLDAVVRPESDYIVVTRGDGFGRFASESFLSLPNLAFYNPNVGVGDLNGDGAPDIVVMGRGTDQTPSLRVWLHRGR